MWSSWKRAGWSAGPPRCRAGCFGFRAIIISWRPGIEESDDDIVAYLDSLAPGALDPETLGAFMEKGPELIRYLADKTPVRFHAYADFPDYQPYMPGAKPDGGRSRWTTTRFRYERLGKWAARVNPSKMAYPMRGSLMEAVAARLTEEMLAEREAGDYRGLGQALVGALFLAVLDRNIPVEFEKRARKLVKDGDRIIGVIAEDANGKDFRVRARRGVVIATGGFEWNETLVKTFIRGPLTGPVSVPENEGDGLIMAIEAGAQAGQYAGCLVAAERAGIQAEEPRCQAELHAGIG